jgi:rare lipoprotein A
MEKKLRSIFFLVCCIFAFKTQAQQTIPLDTSSNSTFFYQEGKASYYHNKLHGKTTASGERYDKNKLTAAHKTLPLGTRVKVINVKSKKWVIVTINDRGPYSKKYIIDLSFRAAKHLGMTNGKGQVKVRIEEVPPKEMGWPQKHVPDNPGDGLKK